MRYFVMAVACLLVLSQAVPAQQPQPPAGQVPGATPSQPPAPTLDPRDPLDSVLMQWESKMVSIQSLAARIAREKVDAVFKAREVFDGEAKYLKPNYALLDMRQRDKPTRIEKYISTGTYLYEYNQPNKEIRFHELPPPKPGQVADDNFLSFLFGMKALEAKRRYEMKLVQQDANYYYLEVHPRFPADKSDFQKAQLAITKNTFFPRQLIFIEPNNNVIRWDILQIESGVVLDRREFMQPQLPDGWRFVKAVRQADARSQTQQPEIQPRIIRPQK